MDRQRFAFLLFFTFLFFHRHFTGVSGATVISSNKYETQYDKIDLDAILRNDRILKRYVDCLMERTTRCTPDAKYLKEVLPDALQSDCTKCSDPQKKMAGKVLSYILQYKRNYWEELTKKYDPKGTFRRKHGYDENVDYSNYE